MPAQAPLVFPPSADPALVPALGRWIEPVSPQTLCDTVYERFTAEPDLFALPVVDGTQPVGLINRQSFMVTLADRFGRALYEKKTVTRLMDSRPLIVRSDMLAEDIGIHIVEMRPSALLEGFIVEKEGAYCGIGTALSLLTLTLEAAQRRNRELDEARQRAEDANRTKNEFLANMSHELRTPLNAIIGFSEVLSVQLFGPLGEDRYVNYVRDINDSGRHLLGIINDILDLAKVEAGSLELREQEVDVEDLLVSCLRLVEDRFQSGNIAVSLAVPEVPCALMCDPRILKQVLLNLLSNAAKFTNPGGELHFGAERLSDATLRITIRDTGIGMTVSEIDKAMQPFTQVDSCLNRKYEGTGLGLPLVKRMTEAHEGVFVLESAPAVGTTARIILPAARVRILSLDERIAESRATAG
ncbi:MAG: ATP-binding protein [Alphaproteobacteria bacterium]